MIKRLAKNKDLPVRVFTYWTPDSIILVATDIWDLTAARTSWMDNPDIPGGKSFCADIDLMGYENVWTFPRTAEGENAAHKKMCEIYAEELKLYHKEV